MEKKVLLVVDMQLGFMRKTKYRHIIGKINTLIESGGYDKIIFTKFRNRGRLFRKKLNWKNLKSERSQQIVVNCPQNAVVLTKSGYEIESKDLEFIKNLNCEQIDVCGIQTDACVYAISLQLFDNGIFPNVLFNYTATYCDEDVLKKLFIHQFGSIDERK